MNWHIYRIMVELKYNTAVAKQDEDIVNHVPMYLVAFSDCVRYMVIHAHVDDNDNDNNKINFQLVQIHFYNLYK